MKSLGPRPQCRCAGSGRGAGVARRARLRSPQAHMASPAPSAPRPKDVAHGSGAQGHGSLGSGRRGFAPLPSEGQHLAVERLGMDWWTRFRGAAEKRTPLFRTGDRRAPGSHRRGRSGSRGGPPTQPPADAAAASAVDLIAALTAASLVPPESVNVECVAKSLTEFLRHQVPSVRLLRSLRRLVAKPSPHDALAVTQ